MRQSRLVCAVCCNASSSSMCAHVSVRCHVYRLHVWSVLFEIPVRDAHLILPVAESDVQSPEGYAEHDTSTFMCCSSAPSIFGANACSIGADAVISTEDFANRHFDVLCYCRILQPVHIHHLCSTVAWLDESLESGHCCGHCLLSIRECLKEKMITAEHQYVYTKGAAVTHQSSSDLSGMPACTGNVVLLMGARRGLSALPCAPCWLPPFWLDA